MAEWWAWMTYRHMTCFFSTIFFHVFHFRSKSWVFNYNLIFFLWGRVIQWYTGSQSFSITAVLLVLPDYELSLFRFVCRARGERNPRENSRASSRGRVFRVSLDETKRKSDNSKSTVLHHELHDLRNPMQSLLRLNYRMQGHLFTSHWITKVPIVFCFVLEKILTHVKQVVRSGPAFCSCSPIASFHRFLVIRIIVLQ